MKTSYETLRKGDVLEDVIKNMPVLCVVDGMLEFALSGQPKSTKKDALIASLEVSGATFFQVVETAAKSSSVQMLVLSCVILSEEGILVSQRYGTDDDKYAIGMGGYIVPDDAAGAIIARLSGVEKNAGVINLGLSRHLKRSLDKCSISAVNMVDCLKEEDGNHLCIVMAVAVNSADDVGVNKDVLRNPQWVSPDLLAREEWQEKLTDYSRHLVSLLAQEARAFKDQSSANDTSED